MALKFPKNREVLDLVELLIGEPPILKPGEGWDLTHPGAGSYITFLQNRDLAVEGAIITNLPATLYIGGKLILLPNASLAEQAARGAAADSVVEAVTEVVNNLRSLFNNIDGNPHVAPTQTFSYLVPTPDDYVGWILEPDQRVDYTGETAYGTATMTLLGR